LKKRSRLSRRSFLLHTGRIVTWGGALSLLGPLPGCGGGEREPDSDRSGADADAGAGADADRTGTDGSGPAASAQAPPPADDPCGDVSALTDEERTDREDVAYVSQTPDPEKRCDNCELWKPPEGGSPCGGCEILAGPVHPQGYCDVWVPV
jgi:hypothetical protein